MSGNPFASGAQTSRDPTPRTARPNMHDLINLSGGPSPDVLKPSPQNQMVGRQRVSSLIEAGAANGLGSAEAMPRRRSYAFDNLQDPKEESKTAAAAPKDLINALADKDNLHAQDQ